MRSLISFSVALAGGVGSAVAAAGNSTAAIRTWVGSGADTAGLIIGWQDAKNLPGDSLGQALAWGFHWNPGTSPTGLDMLSAISAADPRLEVKFDNRGFGSIVFGIYYDLDGDGGAYAFDPGGETGAASDPADHFREGWLFNGFWGYEIGNAASTNRPAFSESGTGVASRTLTNNSWDAWVFSTDLDQFVIPAPSAAAAAVPEPGAVTLLALGGLLLWRRK